MWKESIANRRRGYDPAFRYVFIPYHWPVISYVAGWAVLIVWRSRKYRALPPESGEA